MDCCPAEIRIGGRLSSLRVSELCKAIAADRVSLEYDEFPFVPTTAVELLVAKRDGCLELYSSEAPYGEFSEIEELCRQSGLSFRRHSDSVAGMDACIADWRPGFSRLLYRPSGNEEPDLAYVSESEVRSALELLEAGDTASALVVLRRLCPKVEEIPPFEVG